VEGRLHGSPGTPTLALRLEEGDKGSVKDCSSREAQSPVHMGGALPD
jgi:hypothetical protein